MSRLSPVAWLVITLIVAASGWAYAVMVREGAGHIGAIYAEMSFLPLLAFRQKRFLPGLHDWLNALPTALYIVAELVIYGVIIAAGFAVAGSLMWLVGIYPGGWAEAALLSPETILYALAVSSLVIFVLRMRDLIGREVFASLLVGRYRKPIAEERIFLFVDLVGSTSYAERNGDLRAQQYLGVLFRVMADPVRRHGGTINDYIGDCAIITWPIEKGLQNADCVCCAFAICDAIENRADRWLKRFGEIPRLRAALHGGPVVTAEVGVDYHKIAYFGDTVNTTARLEQLCKAVGADMLVSNELLGRMQLPADFVADDRGSFGLRGRGQEISVSSLSKRPSAALAAADRQPSAVAAE